MKTLKSQLSKDDLLLQHHWKGKDSKQHDDSLNIGIDDNVR